MYDSSFDNLFESSYFSIRLLWFTEDSEKAQKTVYGRSGEDKETERQMMSHKGSPRFSSYICDYTKPLSDCQTDCVLLHKNTDMLGKKINK